MQPAVSIANRGATVTGSRFRLTFVDAARQGETIQCGEVLLNQM